MTAHARCKVDVSQLTSSSATAVGTNAVVFCPL